MLSAPISFTRWPVSLLLLVTYLGLFTGLLYVHLVPPSAPNASHLPPGTNLTEARLDLQHLSSQFHPYNSRRNDQVRQWLLHRINSILDSNNASSSTEAIVYDDNISNATFSGSANLTVYFEGTNIIVYVRGSADPSPSSVQSATENSKRGVLVNAHYDSVSTGYGATDDGIGVVTILQLIRYFTTSGQAPTRGIVALLNNGEEDYLNGARAFVQHPISAFPDTFLNLEGAGAGGRATLFRSTDTTVTQCYQKSPYPFGTVASADGFRRGLVRSQTDYVVFNEDLKLRGLDVAFWEPRARYHTVQDSARRTDLASLWHMLSASLATTKCLSSDVETPYSKDAGSFTVYFDLFGKILGVAPIDTFFVLSVVLLVVGPIALISVLITLARVDRLYLFARNTKSDPLDAHTPDEEVDIVLAGWRGYSRAVIAFILATAASIALSLLIAKVNPYISYSSEWAVWSTLLSSWLIIVWFIMRGADYMRPSALHRAHSLGWVYVFSWLALVAGTIAEHNFQMGSGYVVAIFNAAALSALLVSYIEMSKLARKSDYIVTASYATTREEERPATSSSRASRLGKQRQNRPRSSIEEDSDPTERTSLLGSRSRSQPRIQPEDIAVDGRGKATQTPFGDEQGWSAALPSWLWVLEYLLLGPINIIIFGQLALFFTTGLHQTPADGNPVLTLYLVMAVIGVFLLLPTLPFIHRISNRIPAFLFLVLVGTLIYNLTAFPFSEESPLKIFFLQKVDLDRGTNSVTLTGIDGHLQAIVASMPSAAGQKPHCGTTILPAKNGLRTCSWHGAMPHIAGPPSATAPYTNTSAPHTSWVRVSAKRNPSNPHRATFHVSGANTRNCKLLFDAPIADYNVTGAAASSAPLPRMPPGGATEIRLWSRTWNRTWSVDVEWAEGAGAAAAARTGSAVCMWNNGGVPGVVPAMDEVMHNMPVWAIVSKASDGLVEASTAFKV